MSPETIIFDTDIGCDCDDAGALALLHRLCDKGEARLLAVTHCQNSPYFVYSILKNTRMSSGSGAVKTVCLPVLG